MVYDNPKLETPHQQPCAKRGQRRRGATGAGAVTGLEGHLGFAIVGIFPFKEPLQG